MIRNVLPSTFSDSDCDDHHAELDHRHRIEVSLGAGRPGLRATMFPDHEPYRAWANFEFIALDGSINEVDLLLLHPHGLLPGRDQEPPRPRLRRRRHLDLGDRWPARHRRQPADRGQPQGEEAAALLQQQRACQKKGAFPSSSRWSSVGPDLNCELRDNAASASACGTGSPPGQPARPGLMAAVIRRGVPRARPHAQGDARPPLAKVISQAMEQAGIRPSQRHRKVSDYLLERLIEEGPGLPGLGGQPRPDHRRQAARPPLPRRARPRAEDRQMIERAALRDFQLLETLQHPGVLRAHGFTEHEVGPAIIFEHDPLSLRLDHFLTQHRDRLRVDIRLDLVRQIAEVVRFAHEKKVVHRALCPQSILVTDPEAPARGSRCSTGRSATGQGTPRPAARRTSPPPRTSNGWSRTPSTAYMAPEAVSG